MFDARTWLYLRLVELASIETAVGDRIFQDLQETPDQKPFIVIRMDPAQPEIPTAMSQDALIWVHDDPGSYLNIDSILANIRDDLDGAQIIDPDGIAARWQGDSIDLADDARGTIVRTSSYRLVGRR